MPKGTVSGMVVDPEMSTQAALDTTSPQDGVVASGYQA